MSNLLILGLLASNETDKQKCNQILKDLIQNDYHYEFVDIFLKDIFNSYLIENNKAKNLTKMDEKYVEREVLDECNNLEEIFVLSALRLIKLDMKKRQKDKEGDKQRTNCVYVIGFLRSQQEVELLRHIFGLNIFLISLFSSRLNNSTQDLVTFDVSNKKFFFQSDAFFNIDDMSLCRIELKRFLDLIFGNPFITPNKHEYGMYLAFASSLRSSSLSRQVGAVIMSEKDDIIAITCNEVPKPGGGQYWSCIDAHNDGRQFKFSNKDSNKSQIDNIILDVAKKFISDADCLKNTRNDKELLEKAREKLKNTQIFNLTEYFREIHAETEALICCARNAVSTLNSTMYCTTFPCHYCMKHIVSAGIKKCYFIEPYAKSKIDLYTDSIVLNDQNDQEKSKVNFQQFYGIGPRRYFDLFSLVLSNGYNLKRKNDVGETIDWQSMKPKQARTPYFNINNLIIYDHYFDEDIIKKIKIFKEREFSNLETKKNGVKKCKLMRKEIAKYLETIQEFLIKSCDEEN